MPYLEEDKWPDYSGELDALPFRDGWVSKDGAACPAHLAGPLFW